MRAAVLHSSPGPLEIEDLTLDAPGPREVRIRTTNAGLCHSDLHFMDGSWQIGGPTVMGHEGAGVVEAVGSEVRYVEPGDHVITCVSVFCGTCRYCTNGQMTLCANRAQVTERGRATLETPSGEPRAAFADLGTFGEEMLVHEHGVVKIRDDMPLDKAALIGCGVTTGLGAVFRTARVEPGSSVAIIGCGGIGLSAMQGARIAGAAQIIAVDVTAKKLEQAKALGATAIVNAAESDPVEAVKELSRGGVDHAFEAIGKTATAEQAFAMLAPGGTATVIGMIPVGDSVSIPGFELFAQEKKIQGSNMGSNQFRTDMPRFIELYLDGRLKLDEMVSRHITLDEINAGYDAMRRAEGTRSVIVF